MTDLNGHLEISTYQTLSAPTKLKSINKEHFSIPQLAFDTDIPSKKDKTDFSAFFDKISHKYFQVRCSIRTVINLDATLNLRDARCIVICLRKQIFSQLNNRFIQF